MIIPIPLQEALRDSITSGTFIDTKFWVFSKRGSKSGRVGEPKALFINRHVARRVPRLGSLLGRRETKENLRARFPTDRKPYTDDYDYEDDSDLEEDDEEDILYDAPTGAPQALTEKPRDSFDMKCDESLDIVSLSDLDSLFSDSSDPKDEVGTASPTHVGTVVIIEDVAFVTFQAFLRYLYTSEIEFAPWGSPERRKARALEKISGSYGIPKPSPKSVYRLADQYDIPELKELALRRIQQDLTKCNIAEEVFSKYTSWYPELRELELKQLTRALLSSSSDPTLGVLKTKIKSYANGQLLHAEDVLPALYELMEGDESIEETPLPIAASSNQQVTGGDWDELKKALTSSLTSGTFLDSQFYVAEPRLPAGLPKIRPIYFCSTVGGTFASNLVACSSKLRTWRAPVPRCANGHHRNNDDEKADLTGSMDRYPCSKFVRENPTPTNLPMEPALLLKSGAVKAWSAIFFFVYTGQIVFATLDSQDVPPSETKENQGGYSPEERDPPQSPGRSSVPPPRVVVTEPCCPKSIYCQANEVGLAWLCEIAFEDIRSKLDESNIVQELFSPFAASHRRISEMEHELFQSKLKPLVDTALLSKMIRSSSSGKNPHRAAAMELIFERSIRERHQRVSTKVRNTLQLDPTPQGKEINNAPCATVLQLQPHALPPAPQSPSHLLSNTNANPLTKLISSFATYEASPDSSTSSNPAENAKVVQYEEPSTNANAESSRECVFPLEHVDVQKESNEVDNGTLCTRAKCSVSTNASASLWNERPGPEWLFPLPTPEEPAMITKNIEGMKGEEALRVARDVWDEAVRARAPQLRFIVGLGKAGTQLKRKIVKSLEDEHNITPSKVNLREIIFKLPNIPPTISDQITISD